MGGDSRNTPNIWESVYQRVLILEMGQPRSLSSCDEAQLWDRQRMNYLLLGLYVWLIVGIDWGEV